MYVCYCLSSRFLFVVFFFFKQKTAYEMRISDWSSDVCSSDLLTVGEHVGMGANLVAVDQQVLRTAGERPGAGVDVRTRDQAAGNARRHAGVAGEQHLVVARDGPADVLEQGRRSEEHTSELQSLMRISYAVFCLKKKKNITQN